MLATLVGHETFAVNYAVAFLLDPAICSRMEGMTLFRETVRAYLPAAPGADGRGALMPVRLALVGAIAVSLLAPVLAPAALLVALLIVGLPSFGTLFTPAAALLSAGADRLQLNQALAFGLTNLAWASGQAVGAAATGVLAQATSDLLPYGLLAATCLATLAVLQSRARRPAGQAG